MTLPVPPLSSTLPETPHPHPRNRSLPRHSTRGHPPSCSVTPLWDPSQTLLRSNVDPCTYVPDGHPPPLLTTSTRRSKGGGIGGVLEGDDPPQHLLVRPGRRPHAPDRPGPGLRGPLLASTHPPVTAQFVYPFCSEPLNFTESTSRRLDPRVGLW